MYKVKVVWHKNDGIALVIDIQSVPKFLGEKVESGRVAVLVGAHIWQSPQRKLNILLLTYLLCSVGMDQRNAYRSEDVVGAVLAIDELKVRTLELLDNNVLTQVFGKLWCLMGVNVLYSCDVI